MTHIKTSTIQKALYKTNIDNNYNEIKALRDKYNKLLADYQELSKSLSNVKRDIVNVKYRHDIIRKFTELYQDAKRGLKYNEKGATLLFRKLCKIFNELEIEILNVEWFQKHPDFDERFAEAVNVTETLFEEYDNTVEEVVEDGFMDKDGIIVYAKVIVAKYGI